MLAADAVLFVAIIWVFWVAVYDFNGAAWAFGAIAPTDTLPKVLLVSGAALAVVLMGAASGIAGFYGHQGYRWARVAALIALATSLLALLLNPLAWAAIALAAVGAVMFWLPPSTRFFLSWRLRRHPEPSYAPIRNRVYYGPLPKYQR
jgi:hypothetical protein